MSSQTKSSVGRRGTGATRTIAEHQRLQQCRDQGVAWKKWGPYLSERQWGTVREDYSEGGDAWNYFPHDHARSRAYRWSEDGLGGICDIRQRLCVQTRAASVISEVGRHRKGWRLRQVARATFPAVAPVA
jgi:hypothetical protein